MSQSSWTAHPKVLSKNNFKPHTMSSTRASYFLTTHMPTYMQIKPPCTSLVYKHWARRGRARTVLCNFLLTCLELARRFHGTFQTHSSYMHVYTPSDAQPSMTSKVCLRIAVSFLESFNKLYICRVCNVWSIVGMFIL